MIKEILTALRDLGALEKRTEDVLTSLRSIHAKVDSISDRVTRLEMNQEHLRSSVKSDILSDIKTEIALTQERIGRLQNAAKLSDQRNDA